MEATVGLGAGALAVVAREIESGMKVEIRNCHIAIWKMRGRHKGHSKCWR